jgi:type IV pilus assembly protein PilX
MEIKKMTFTTPQKQQGVALAVSLIFLVLITIIGVTSIRSTTMNELMAANAQQKSTTFQIAESVIEGVWDTGYILKNTPTDLTNPPADVLDKDMNDIPFNTMFDVPANGTTAAINVTANATLQYCGEDFKLIGYQQSADESQPAFVAHIYSIHGIGNLAAAHASSDHDQRGYLVRPEAGRTGNCP